MARSAESTRVNSAAAILTRRRDVVAVAVMLMVITLLHYWIPLSYFTFHNVLRTLYYVPIIWAAFRLGLLGGTISALTTSILYSPHVLLYFRSLPVESANDLQEIALFNIVGVLTGWLVEAEKKQANRYEEVVDELELSYVKLQQHAEAVEGMRAYIGNILDSLGCGVITLDLRHRVTTSNPAAKAILGVDPVGRSFLDIARDRIIGDVESVLRSGSPQYLPAEVNNGIRTPVSIHFSPLKTAELQVIGSVAIIEDFTEVKDLEKQVRQAEKMSSLGNLAGSLAHEIRNPVGIIRAAAQMLDNDLVDERMKECTSVIRQESDRIERLVQELLDYARPRLPMLRNVDVVQLVYSVASVVHAYAAQQRVDIRIQASEAVPPLWGDEEQLHQCLSNLVLNAIQAMPQGGTVTVKAHPQRPSSPDGPGDRNGQPKILEISVADMGTGITEEELQHIFEPFFSTKANGTGLGLAIVQRVVEQHGGRIEVSSMPGQGSDFKILLPISTSVGETGRSPLPGI